MDPRVARSTGALRQATIDLLRDVDLHEISVSDIVTRADVNRSTFYQHYSDKHELIADAIEELLQDASFDMDAIGAPQPGQPPAALAEYLGHFAAHADVYARVLGDHGSPLAGTRIHQQITRLALLGVDAHGKDTFVGVPRSIAAAGFAGLVVSVLAAWLALPDRPGADVAAGWMWAVLSAPGAAQAGGRRLADVQLPSPR